MVVTRSCCCWFVQQGLQCLCFSKWQCQGVLRPLQRHQCSLSWVTDVFLDNRPFLLSPKPAVHIAGDIILYGQWPGQGQSVLKWLCQRPKSTGTPGPLVSEHMTSSFPDFWLLGKEGIKRRVGLGHEEQLGHVDTSVSGKGRLSEAPRKLFCCFLDWDRKVKVLRRRPVIQTADMYGAWTLSASILQSCLHKQFSPDPGVGLGRMPRPE